MGRYSPEEIETMRANVKSMIERGGAKAKNNGLWTPDWTVHDEYNMPRPGIMSREEFDILIQSYSTGTRATRERQELIWDPYIQAVLARVLKNKDAEPLSFTILGGTSATGKGTYRNADKDEQVSYFRSIIQAGIPSRDIAVHVDPDEAKLILPEYIAHIQYQTPGGANFVHSESREIAEKLRRTAILKDLSIVYDTSGQFNSGTSIIQEMRDGGYQVPAMYFFAPPQEISRRVSERAKRTGRNIPGYIPLTMQNNLTSIVPSLFSQGLFDTLRLYDTESIDEPVEIFSWRRDGLTSTYADEEKLLTYWAKDEDWWNF